MSAKAGTIATPVIHRRVWAYWVAVAVLAAVVAGFAVWAMIGREAAPAIDSGPKVTVVAPPSEAPTGPPQFRQGPNGESYPAPRVGR